MGHSIDLGTIVPVALMAANAIARVLFPMYLRRVGTALLRQLAACEKQWHTFAALHAMTGTSRPVTRQVVFNLASSGLVHMRLQYTSDDHAKDTARMQQLPGLEKFELLEYSPKRRLPPRRARSTMRLAFGELRIPVSVRF